MRAAGKARRAPVDWRRYSAQVKRARRNLPRYEHPLAVSVAASLVFAVAGAYLLQLAGVGLAAGVRDLRGAVTAALPQAKESELVLGETQVTISAAPVLDPLPEFTKDNTVQLAGKIPAFAAQSGRRVAVDLNGKLVTSVAIAADGRFGPAPLTLPDGTSTVKATLVEGTTEIASASQSIVVRRTPPALSIVRPKPGESVDGPDVVIEGKTDPGSEVSVNGRALRPNPDGTFTERISAVPIGPFALTILSKDKAGNEAKGLLNITVKQAVLAPTGTTLVVTLDRTTVRPGETVVAQVVAVEGGKPRADLAVTLQVGVFTVGTYKTDASGTLRVGFAAPDHEVVGATVVVLGGGASATASLTVAR